MDILPSGLSSTEVTQRQAKFGFNELQGQEIQWWQVLFRQFQSPFLYLLIGAAILSFFLGEKIDAAMIIFFVLINGLLGFYQEFHSEQTIKLLRAYVVSQARVIRAGKEVLVPSRELVPDDIVVLEPGDLIPADIRLLEQEGLLVNESVLTGESAPVAKKLDKAENMCFSGTTVTAGKAVGVVLKTGSQTAIGKIAHLATATNHMGSFEKAINRLSQFILRLIVATVIFLVIVNLILKWNHVDIPNLIVFAIALAVFVIPEGLPVVITFSLSRGALHLAKNKVVVKRLAAIEDLGSIEVLCTDKTGTLTHNTLTVADHFSHGDRDPLVYAALASSLEKQSRSVNSFDKALHMALSSSQKDSINHYQRLQETPFDPERKRNSVIVKKEEQTELIVRGAPEEIVKLCSHLSHHEVEHIHAWMKQEGKEGKRVIAIASRMMKEVPPHQPNNIEHNLQFIGCVSFIDPVKESALSAIEKARHLGVQIKILTGDSAEVAEAVARQVGLVKKDGVITGADFDALSVQQQHEALGKYDVFARVSPEQKFKIIQLLEEKHEVGFLGEGINDAPALQVAHVGIVVQEATDIAREAADIILLKKNLHVIVDGIHQGRLIFANTTKYIRATLASNFGNFYTVTIVSLFTTFLPLLPVQILLTNLLTDFPMISIAADTVDTEEMKRPRNYDVKEIAFIATILGIVSSVFDFLLFGLFFHLPPHVFQTNWFMGSVFTELVFLFSIRSRRPIWQAKRPAGILFILSIIAFIVGLVLPFTSVGMRFFYFQPPSREHIMMILTVVGGYLVATESVKLLYHRAMNGK